jgi:hypothetical protein
MPPLLLLSPFLLLPCNEAYVADVRDMLTESTAEVPLQGVVT